MTRIKQGEAALRDEINPALVLAHAHAWVGTPFRRRGALRYAGADCIGLIRGIYAELAGSLVMAPPWRSDWAATPDEPILEGLRLHVLPVPLDEVKPGHIVTHRVGRKRAAHVSILTGHGAIHASERPGVIETPPLSYEITSAWALPCLEGYERGPSPLTVDDCLAVIYRDGQGYHAEIVEMLTGAGLALTKSYPTAADTLAALEPIYPNIECVE